MGAAIYILIATSIDSSESSLYLLLNSLLPLVVSAVALVLIPFGPFPRLPSSQPPPQDSHIFLFHYVLAVITGLYLLISYPLASSASVAKNLLAGALFLIALPTCLPHIVYALDCLKRTNHLSSHDSELKLPVSNDQELVELRKALVGRTEILNFQKSEKSHGFLGKVMQKGCLNELCDEHTAKFLLSSCDFWLYYFAYLCGGTIGFVYSNNLGQIAESLGHQEELRSYLILFAACSFFGRLLSAVPDFLKKYALFFLYELAMESLLLTHIFLS